MLVTRNSTHFLMCLFSLDMARVWWNNKGRIWHFGEWVYFPYTAVQAPLLCLYGRYEANPDRLITYTRSTVSVALLVAVVSTVTSQQEVSLHVQAWQQTTWTGQATLTGGGGIWLKWLCFFMKTKIALVLALAHTCSTIIDKCSYSYNSANMVVFDCRGKIEKRKERHFL